MQMSAYDLLHQSVGAKLARTLAMPVSAQVYADNVIQEQQLQVKLIFQSMVL
jgi:hypothetical protein